MFPITERVKYLKEQVLNIPPALRADRSMIAKGAFLAHQEEDRLLQRAHILEAVLHEIPINILDRELIVGLPGDSLNVAQIFLPENSAEQLIRELDTLPTREQDRFLVPDQVKNELLELASFWNGKTANDRITAMISPGDQKLLDAGVFFIQKDVGYGHCLADYETVLKIGFVGLKQRAQRQLGLAAPADERRPFWEAVSIVCQAAMDYSVRYAALAEQQAERCSDAARQAELRQIAGICRKAPLYGAESFQEALQTLWMAHLIIQLESDGTGVSFGRLDQYLYPYYCASQNAGQSQEALQELLDCFWIKTNHLLKYRPLAAAKLWSGYIINQNVTIAGSRLDGSDATNALSYMCVECQKRLCLKEPQFSLRVCDGTPTALLKSAAEALATGGGKPQFVSDPTIIPSLRHLGVPEDEAKNYAIIGCVEPGVVGGWGRCKSGHINLPKVLELLLNNGVDPVTHSECGMPVGVDFPTFEDFFAAFASELNFVVGRLIGIQANVTHRVLEEEMPHVYLSSMFPDCIEKGLDFTRGGSRHDWSSFTITGMANVIDSFYTVKKLVYEQKAFSMAALCRALAADFAGYDDMLRQILALPKYGNDIAEVDDLGGRIAGLLYDTVEQYCAHHHSRVTIGYVTVTKSVSYGKRTGATPDGRHAFEAFADGVSPSHNFDVKGPTAVMNSASKLNLMRAGEGCILNQKFVANALKEDYQREKFANFLKTFLIDLGGLHVQFNIVDKATLLAAQENPAAYKHLLVRVSGFSAYFVDLSREVQEDVIGRTEFQGI